MATDQIISQTADLLWMGGLAASPLAILIGCICRCKSLRPSTRHMLWFAALASFVTPMLGAMIWRPQWFRSEALIAAADSVLPERSAAPSSPASAAPEPARPDVTGSASPRSGGSLAFDRKAVSGHELSANHSKGSLPTRVSDQAWKQPLADAPITAVAELSTSAGFGEQKGLGESSRVGGSFDASEVEDSLAKVSSGMLFVPSSVLRDPPSRWESSKPEGALRPTPNQPSRASSAIEQAATTVERPVIAPGVESPGSAPIVAAASSSWADVRGWLVRLLGVRDAIAELPRVPGVLWVGGALLLITISVVRTLLAGRWVKRAVPADAAVQASVRQVGEALGLQRTPRAYFVDAAVSPMIWCGWKTRLILPERLWRTLDADARRAVLVHELAHVRRGDHLVCWVQAAIGAIYWWHPVVWWARKRLHDEAEASCDAWVTSLFPRHRRAYASALLVTTSYISLNERQGGPWLGVVSKSAKRLARRITMVMTERSAPGKSVIGVCVATLVLTAGTFVMPGLACPPEKETKEVKSTKELRVLTSDGRTTVVVPGKALKTTQSGSAKARAGQPAEPGVQFLGEAPALDAMRESVTVEGRALTPSRAGAHAAPAAPRAAQPAKAPRAPRMPTPPAAITVPGQLHVESYVAVPGQALARGGQEQPEAPAGFERYTVGRTARQYAMADDKLDAFYGFMSRDDVPILVQRTGGGIIIWANDSEHAVFEKFVGIVGGSAKAGAVLPGQNPLTVVAGQQAALAELQAAKARGGAANEAAQRYRSMLREIERSRDAFERDTDRAREEAEAARERAEELRELAIDLDAKAASLGAEERAELEVASKRLYARSDTLANQAEALESRLAHLEQMLAQAEERAAAIEERLDELDSDSGEPEMIDEVEVPAAPEAAQAPVAPEAPEAPPAADEVAGVTPAAAPTPDSVPAPAASPSPAPAPAPASGSSAA